MCCSPFSVELRSEWDKSCLTSCAFTFKGIQMTSALFPAHSKKQKQPMSHFWLFSSLRFHHRRREVRLLNWHSFEAKQIECRAFKNVSFLKFVSVNSWRKICEKIWKKWKRPGCSFCTFQLHQRRTTWPFSCKSRMCCNGPWRPLHAQRQLQRLDSLKLRTRQSYIVLSARSATLCVKIDFYNATLISFPLVNQDLQHNAVFSQAHLDISLNIENFLQLLVVCKERRSERDLGCGLSIIH